VLDSAGCGALPDAAAYGDAGSNTLGHVASSVGLHIPNLQALGLGQVVDLAGGRPPVADGAFGRMAEASPGKDSVTGHWELMGVVLDRPFPTFPAGFPQALVRAFEARIGRATLGNVVASGTEIIERLGAEHLRTGKPIIYTSADSVFQVAAHDQVIPVSALYEMCEAAFDLAARGLGVGRVIARPFTGRAGAFTRTAARRDYALPPPRDTLLDRLTADGVPIVTIGKVSELFAGRGVGRAVHTSGDTDGLNRVEEAIGEGSSGLVFANLVDFDTMFGHRNDAAGYAANLERFDRRLGKLRRALRPSDLLVITADHGNDPTTPSTDHSREYVPLLATGRLVRQHVNLGTRASFADLGQTLAENFAVGPLSRGLSFLEDIVGEHS
jgi:phosphopentomutase